jgi:hypothetical protein
MQKYLNSAKTLRGDAINNAHITVRDLAGTLATIYSDNGVTVQANPVISGRDGEYMFYAANGRYSITIAANGFISESVNDVLLYDPSEPYTPIDPVIANSAASAFANAALTAADRIQTGEDRIAASGSAADALASQNAASDKAAEALGYLQAYRATSYGALAADPALDPLGNAPTAGDEYFNTTSNLLKRFNGTAWQVPDINTTNLAAAGGAGMVGVGDITVADALGLRSIDLLEKIPKSQWAAIAARTSAYDCAPALVAAVATGRRVTISMPGKFKFTTAYSGTTDFDVEALCGGVEFDLSSVAGIVIKNSGSITQIQELAADIAQGRSIATFASAPSLSVGDWFCIYNPTDFSYSGWRDYYRAGEWKQVRSIAGNVVTTTAPFCAAYAVADVDVYRMNSVRSRLARIKLLGGATPTQLVLFSLCEAPEFDNISFDTQASSAIGFDRCVNGLLFNPRGSNTGTASGTQYGFVNGNSQHTRIYGGDIYSTRHAIANGGNAELCCVPVRDFRCYETTLKNDPEISVGSADMHGNIEDSSYERCTIYGGANLSGGGNTWYNDCDIYAPSGEVQANAIGWVAYLREVKGGVMGFKRCRFFTSRNPQPSTRGLIDIGGNSVSVDARTTDPLTFVLHNCSLYGRNLSALTSLVNFRNRGSVAEVNFDIQNLALDVDALSAILRTDLVTGTAAASKIIVIGISGAPAGTYLHSAAGSFYLNFPHRLQRQTGVYAATTVLNGTSVISALITYPMAYPRKPIATLSVAPDANLAQSTSDGQVAMARAYQVSNLAVRPMLQTVPAVATLATQLTATAAALTAAASAASGTPELETALTNAATAQTAAAAAETSRGKFTAGGVLVNVNWSVELAEC